MADGPGLVSGFFGSSKASHSIPEHFLKAFLYLVLFHDVGDRNILRPVFSSLTRTYFRIFWQVVCSRLQQMKHIPHVVNIFDASFKSTLSWLQYKQKQTQTPSYFAWLLWFLNPPFFSPGDLGLSVCWCSRCCCRRRCSWFCYRYVCIAACRGVLSDISSWRRQRIHGFYTDRRGERCESISLKFLQPNFSRLFPLTQMCIVFHFFVAWIDHFFFELVSQV